MNSRPLLVRFGALGDMTILTVMIRLLHERFGEPVDIVGSGGWTRPLLQGQPGVGELYLIRSRRRPFWSSPEQWRLMRDLRNRGAGPTWLCDESNEKILRLLARAGWRETDSCHYSGLTGMRGPHMCDLWQRFAYRNPVVLGGNDLPIATQQPARGVLAITPHLRTELDAWLQSRGLNGHSLILVQVGNKRTMRRGSVTRSSNSKYWPEENWATVIRSLRERHPSHAMLLLGVPQEAALNDEILRLARVDRAFNVAHDVPIPRLLALAERATGTVSVDTGPAHVVAAVGCPVVTLFGKTNPQLYAPRGPNDKVICLTGTFDGQQSMLGITPDEVLSAWRTLVPA